MVTVGVNADSGGRASPELCFAECSWRPPLGRPGGGESDQPKRQQPLWLRPAKGDGTRDWSTEPELGVAAALLRLRSELASRFGMCGSIRTYLEPPHKKQKGPRARTYQPSRTHTHANATATRQHDATPDQDQEQGVLCCRREEKEERGGGGKERGGKELSLSMTDQSSVN